MKVQIVMPTSFLQQLKALPRLGFGLGLKETYTEDLLNHIGEVSWAEQVDWLEVLAENFMNKGGRSVKQLQALVDEGFPFASHGVNLSIGTASPTGASPFNETYLKELEALFEVIQPVWFSDHLCFSSAGGHYANDLLPLPFTEESAETCINNILAIKQRIPVPFLIENISYYAHVAENGWDEARWLRHILEEADCGLLLDVNNVYVNARNHPVQGMEPLAFIRSLPLERVVEIHMAGHLEGKELVIDTHGEPIRPEVIQLFSDTIKLCPNLKGVLLERDNNLPPFEVLLAELYSLREASLQVMQGASL